MFTLLSSIVLGFFLGMCHATDPDHVIAVTTIVSRQRSIRHAALIGALCGLGHTITILAVGSAIILFGLVIPARLGLTMELSVGLMLILLGILNLSGQLLSAPPDDGDTQADDRDSNPAISADAFTQEGFRPKGARGVA
jgi:ABC-type nickel/cobalt efflux system permease component RcnA